MGDTLIIDFDIRHMTFWEIIREAVRREEEREARYRFSSENINAGWCVRR